PLAADEEADGFVVPDGAVLHAGRSVHHRNGAAVPGFCELGTPLDPAVGNEWRTADREDGGSSPARLVLPQEAMTDRRRGRDAADRAAFPRELRVRVLDRHVLEHGSRAFSVRKDETPVRRGIRSAAINPRVVTGAGHRDRLAAQADVAIAVAREERRRWVARK